MELLKHIPIGRKMLRIVVCAALTTVLGTDFAATAQQSQRSENTGVRRRSAKADRNKSQTPGVTDRMKQFFETTEASADDSELKWMRIIYRQLDLDKDANAPLYFPEEPIDGNENLFRIIMRLLASNQITAYEYLDGREIFNEQYAVKVKDLLDRFHIIYTNGKGSTERNPKFEIQESDVPANEVLSYYIIERWEYDTRRNKLTPKVEAICPVLHRSGDFGGEAVKYPMFWIKMSDIRPWLAQQPIFTSDDNNLPSSSYDDFFTMNLYDGEIYKTRNLKNKSMMQLYPDPDDRKRAQDSIQARLDSFENKLWVPSREEVLAAREAREAAQDSTAIVQDKKKEPSRSTKRSTRRSSKSKETKAPKVKESKASSSSSATRSVRRRKR